MQTGLLKRTLLAQTDLFERTRLVQTGLLASLKAKINEVKNKISNITNLANTNALIAVESKIPDQSKYITTLEFNKLI